MDRPNLRGRVPDTITARLPGRESDDEGDPTGGPSEDGGTATDEPSDDDDLSDGDGSASRRWTTLLTLAGLGLAALGVVLRYVLDRRGDGEGDDEDDRDGPDLDRDFEGSVQVVGDSGAIDVADEAASHEPTEESETTADESDDAADTERDASVVDAEPEPETDPGVETFEPDRATDEGDGVVIDGDDTETEREGPPRIAPLVGMVALVGIRLFTERVRKRVGEAPAGPADAPAGQL